MGQLGSSFVLCHYFVIGYFVIRHSTVENVLRRAFFWSLSNPTRLKPQQGVHMSNLDDSIHDALLEELRGNTTDVDKEASLREQIAETFRGRSRWFAIISWSSVFVYGVLAVICAMRFFQVATTRAQLAYGILFVACITLAAILKIWYWMLLNRNAITREIKRLELEIAQLGRRMDGK